MGKAICLGIATRLFWKVPRGNANVAIKGPCRLVCQRGNVGFPTKSANAGGLCHSIPHTVDPAFDCVTAFGLRRSVSLNILCANRL